MRKLVSILLCLCMTAGLAACGKNHKDVQEAGKSGVELNFLVMPDIEKVSDVFKEYEKKNTDVKVNVESLPFDKMFEAIEVRLGAKEDSVDVLLVDAPMVANYAAKGYLADMSSYVDDESKGNITEASLGAGTIDGKLMALPLNSSTVNLYYNKEIFKEKGIEVPSEDVDERWIRRRQRNGGK